MMWLVMSEQLVGSWEKHEIFGPPTSYQNGYNPCKWPDRMGN